MRRHKLIWAVLVRLYNLDVLKHPLSKVRVKGASAYCLHYLRFLCFLLPYQRLCWQSVTQMELDGDFDTPSKIGNHPSIFLTDS